MTDKAMTINLTKAEIQSGLDRVRWAEGLILQLPETHDGRNSWLLNYGKSEEAMSMRLKRKIRFDSHVQAAHTGGRNITDTRAEGEAVVSLLPCPFCGSTYIDPEGWASKERNGPACEVCNGTADTIALWNARPTIATLSRQLAEAQAEIEEWKRGNAGHVAAEKRANERLAEGRRMIERQTMALERIVRWHGEFPESGRFWEDGRPMSYGAAYGSNGERDYMRSVASEALNLAPPREHRPAAQREGDSEIGAGFETCPFPTPPASGVTEEMLRTALKRSGCTSPDGTFVHASTTEVVRTILTSCPASAGVAEEEIAQTIARAYNEGTAYEWKYDADKDDWRRVARAVLALLAAHTELE